MADQRLLSLVARIARLEEEKAALAADIKDIYAEAKSAGYSVPALREVVGRRLETEVQRAKREEVERDIVLLMGALGEFVETPLGAAAVGRVAA